MLSLYAVTLRLNSVSNSSINKVFRRSTVCSPFPSLCEWLSVSVLSSAALEWKHGTLRFSGLKLPKLCPRLLELKMINLP